MWTKRDYRIVIKVFYRFIRGLDGTNRYPEEVSWLPTAEPRGKALPPDQLLTEDEVKRLADVAHNMRDRAAVMALYRRHAGFGAEHERRLDVRLPRAFRRIAFRSWSRVMG